jgi:hypothetical protein
MMLKKDFKFGGPIEPELFYDREKEVGFLVDKISKIRHGIKHNYALVGPRRIGKTSILRIVEIKLAENKIIPVFIDCEGREIDKQVELSLELMLSAWGSSVLDAFFEHTGLAEKMKVKLRDFIVSARDRIISALSEVLGRTKALEVKAASDYLEFRLEFEKATSARRPSPEELMKLLDDTLDLAERLGEETGRNFVLMLDEFQNVSKFRKPLDFISTFRRHMQAQRRVAYLLTGSNIGMMEILLRRPFGGHIPIQWIGPFGEEVAGSFLRERFRALRRNVDDKIIDEIVDFTEGHPAYMNWFGEECCKEITRGGRVPLELVRELEEKIFEREGLMHIFEEDLSRVSPRRGKMYATFIEMAGHDLERPSEISKLIARSTTSEIILYLRRLEQRGFVRRMERGRYSIVDGMLKRYVKRKIHTT